jgi:hypothetical protein
VCASPHAYSDTSNASVQRRRAAIRLADMTASKAQSNKNNARVRTHFHRHLSQFVLVIDVFVGKSDAPSLMIFDPDPSPDDVDVRWNADRAKNSSVVVVDKDLR